jgi:hypothetical protein
MPAASPVPPKTFDRPISGEEAASIFPSKGHVGSGMIESNIHQEFAVQEMPLSFEDLKRLNGLR